MTDNNVNKAQMIISFSDRIENIVRRKENQSAVSTVIGRH